MKQSQGPAKIFSGGASKSGLHAKLSHHYGGEAHEEIMGTPIQTDIVSEGGPHGPRKSGGPAIVGGDKLSPEQRALVNKVAKQRSEEEKKKKDYKNDRGSKRSLYTSS
jgi:hypothetical protein